MRRKILLIGTFDMLHAGHINLFYNASLIGDVFVAITSDKLNFDNPNKDKLIYKEKTRLKMIESIIFIEEAEIVDGQKNRLTDIIKKYSITDIAYGSDYLDDKTKNKLAESLNVGKIILPRTEKISSSILRKEVKKW